MLSQGLLVCPHMFCYDPHLESKSIVLDLDVIRYLKDLSSFHQLPSTNAAVVQIMALCLQP